jgi:hypothetical protein
MDNYRSCVGHWWQAMQVSGWSDDADQIRHLLLAECYALVGADKGLQHVYRDAHLAAKATQPEERSLSDDVRARLRALVRDRDARKVGEELDYVLGAWTTPPAEERAVHQAIDGILDHGVQFVRANGADGLHQFIGTFDAWCAKTRRRGGDPFGRRMLDGIAYLSKCSFYLCYSNAWISLISWLREHQDLDDASERFLRFWQMQQQPADEACAVGDVFRGQVLGLHPLSGFFMQDPGLCAVAGRFFASDAYDRVFDQGQADCGEYWDLVGAILTAAHLYRQALDEQQQKRAVRERPGAEHVASAAPVERSIAGLLEEYAAAKGLRCPSCHGGVSLGEYRNDEADGVCQADFSCRACSRRIPFLIKEDELKDWLATR